MQPQLHPESNNPSENFGMRLVAASARIARRFFLQAALQQAFLVSCSKYRRVPHHLKVRVEQGLIEVRPHGELDFNLFFRIHRSAGVGIRYSVFKDSDRSPPTDNVLANG